MYGICVTSIGMANDMDAGKLLPSVAPGSNLSAKININSSAGCFLIGGYIKESSFPIYAKVQLGYGSVKNAEIIVSDNTGYFTVKQSEDT
jgi:hypothetical protein